MTYRYRAYAILRGVIVPVELLWQRSTVEEAIYLGFLRQGQGDRLIVTAEGRRELQRLCDLEERLRARGRPDRGTANEKAQKRKKQP